MLDDTREFRCSHVSATKAGDAFQVLFETTRDALEGYVLIQRHFEFPDGGECYLETDAREFCGHFGIRSANLSRDRFRFEFGNAPVRRIVVLFSATDPLYAEVKRVLQIMLPRIVISRLKLPGLRRLVAGHLLCLDDQIFRSTHTRGCSFGGNAPMLTEFLEKAIGGNADKLEIEYKDREEWITAFRGSLGIGIGSVDSTKRDQLFEDLERLAKSKRATLLGTVYRFSFSESESFGETVYEIRWKREDRPHRPT